MNKRSFLKTLAGVAGAVMAWPFVKKAAPVYVERPIDKRIAEILARAEPRVVLEKYASVLPVQSVREVPRGQMVDYGPDGWVGGVRLPLSRYPVTINSYTSGVQYIDGEWVELSQADLLAIRRGEYEAAFKHSRRYHV